MAFALPRARIQHLKTHGIRLVAAHSGARGTIA